MLTKPSPPVLHKISIIHNKQTGTCFSLVREPCCNDAWVILGVVDSIPFHLVLAGKDLVAYV